MTDVFPLLAPQSTVLAGLVVNDSCFETPLRYSSVSPGGNQRKHRDIKLMWQNQSKACNSKGSLSLVSALGSPNYPS